MFGQFKKKNLSFKPRCGFESNEDRGALFVDLKLLSFCYIDNIEALEKLAGTKSFSALLMIQMAVSEETSPTEKEHLINDLETLFLFS